MTRPFHQRSPHVVVLTRVVSPVRGVHNTSQPPISVGSGKVDKSVDVVARAHASQKRTKLGRLCAFFILHKVRDSRLEVTQEISYPLPFEIPHRILAKEAIHAQVCRAYCRGA